MLDLRTDKVFMVSARHGISPTWVIPCFLTIFKIATSDQTQKTD